MKLLGPNQWRRSAISRVFSALLYSTEAQTASSSSSAAQPSFWPLQRMISQLRNPNVLALPLLRQWLQEGRDLKQPELRGLIKGLRKFRRYRKALQISEWGFDELNYDMCPGDIAVRLDLISKVHGIEEVERYFASIPNCLREFQVYGALLHCYSTHKCLEKAEIVFEKLKELGVVKDLLSYNTMLNLYSRLGKHGKVDSLVKEMEENGIVHSLNTLSSRLYSYAATSDVDRMEKLLRDTEADPSVAMDWHGYALAADAFFKAGQVDKASTLLKKSEQLIHSQTRRNGYQYLMSLYAAIGKKDEVYRIWELYKNMCGFYNKGYLCMVSAMVKLDDIDGAEKIVEEWESENTVYDRRIPILLIKAYCKKGLLEKAKSYAKNLLESGKEACGALTILGAEYHANGLMEEAVETLKMEAKSACPPGWKFNNSIFAACLEYLKEKGDVEAAHELVRIFRERAHFPAGLCDRVDNYIDGGGEPKDKPHL